MRNLHFILLSLVLTFQTAAENSVAQSTDESIQSIENQLEKADELHMSGEEQQSLDLYKQVLKDDPDNVTALWNASVLHAKIGYRKEGDDEMRPHFETAVDLAQRAVENHPDNGYAYYAMAVATGRMTEVMGPADRVRASRKVKENIEKAAERIPDFAPVWHLYGVWHSDVANMSAAVKAAAGLFTGGIPDASNEKAEEYLKKAISMDEDNILFHLDLAKHYMKVDRPEEAIPVLREIMNMESQMKDDPAYINEAKEMLDEIDG
ncbi:tetratricopeptide repeat protein [Rhodohalobacter sp. 8-1]|uniref:tetratricopeptide repeat protein n=1 Tax=Rhodohalobacter sp. 8-1 TaxID=3131972 RepID=UPI0030EF5F94